MSKVTSWLPYDVKPMHVGWYDVRMARGSQVPQPTSNSYWNGRSFQLNPTDYRRFFLTPGDKWRGLAFDPGAPA
jgi:hypothetical protein